MVSFVNYTTDPPRPDLNIYLPSVNPNPVNRRTLLGIFPFYGDANAYIGLALTCDGVHFSQLFQWLGSQKQRWRWGEPRRIKVTVVHSRARGSSWMETEPHRRGMLTESRGSALHAWL